MTDLKLTEDGYIPEGFQKIPSYGVFTNGEQLIVLGDPPQNDDEEKGHNCDWMGCGWDHVLVRAHIVQLGVELKK